MSSTGLKQLVDLSGNIHKLNSRELCRTAKMTAKGGGLKGNYLLTFCWGIKHSSADTH